MPNNQWDEIYKKEGKSYEYYDIIGQPHPDLDKAISEFNKKNVKTVLDLGCGAGRNAWYLAEKGFQVYGMDLAASGLEMLKKLLGEKKLEIELTVGDIFQPLPYPDNFFDAVVSTQVLQHGNEQQILKMMEGLERILKPGGLIFVTLCGRKSQGKIRYCLVKTAQMIAPHTYVPTIGNEIGLTHFIYTKEMIKEHYKNFKIIDLWRDDKDYYAFIASKK